MGGDGRGGWRAPASARRRGGHRGVVNPLDVVKTRIQAQGFRHAAAFPSERAGFSGRRAPSLTLATLGCPPKCPTTGNPHLPRRLCAPECEVYTSSFDVLRKIVRQEGARALFRGTSAALLVAVPTVGIYLPCYDYGNEYLKRQLRRSNDTEHLVPLAPAAAGAASRAFAVLCVAPLDLVRTRAQASRGGARGVRAGDRSGVWTSLSDAARGDARRGGENNVMHRDGASVGVGARGDARDGKTNLSANKGSVFGSLRSGYLRRGGDAAGAVRRLWTGAGPTLARDVPYSALYWFAVEHLREAATETAKGWKNQSNPRLDSRETLCVHFFSGAVAGGAVAALTTPLDVVKTRVQIRDAPSLLDFAGGMSKRESGCVPPANAAAIDTVANRAVKSQSRGLFGELAAVARHGGLSSLFAGWAPRAARAGPTCGIVLVAYEMAKNAPV